MRVTNNVNAPYFNMVGQAPCTGTRAGRPMAVHAHGSASLAAYDGWAEDNICLGEAGCRKSWERKKQLHAHLCS